MAAAHGVHGEYQRLRRVIGHGGGSHGLLEDQVAQKRVVVVVGSGVGSRVGDVQVVADVVVIDVDVGVGSDAGSASDFTKRALLWLVGHHPRGSATEVWRKGERKEE